MTALLRSHIPPLPLLFPSSAQYFVGLILILVFAGVPGLYGLIVALLLNVRGVLSDCHADTYNACCPNGGYLVFDASGVAQQVNGDWCVLGQ